MNVAYDFTGKSVLVAGGAAGIGYAVTDLLGESGANILIADYNEEVGHKALAEFKAKGYNVAFIRCDVRKKEEVFASVAKTVELYGRIDYAANVCGISGGKGGVPFHEYDDDFRDNVLNTNLKGHWWLLQAELGQMVKQGGEGYAIVEVSSIQAFMASVYQGAYATSKHAVTGMIKAVAAEYGTQGIRINGYAPTMVLIPMMEQMHGERLKTDEAALCGNPRGTILRPWECAQAIVWLLSDGASSINALTLLGDCGCTGIRKALPRKN